MLCVSLSSVASASSFPTSFPKNFKWCVATAAHQIEGGNVNSDWWDWEQIPGNVKRGERSGAACDHWNRLDEDIRLLTELHVRQYRFSIEWAKLEPVPGTWDDGAVAHYRRELKLLREAGIEPMITLQHFTLPKWLREKGGWEWDGAPAAFARFAAFAFETIAPEVRDWVTINEPMVHLTLGYLAGKQPPSKKGSMADIHGPVVGLLKAHAAAYHAMKARHAELKRRLIWPFRPYRLTKELRIGLANHLRIFDPASEWNPGDSFIAGKLDAAFNWAFPMAAETGRLRYNIPFQADVDELIPGLAHTQDFFGLNYYTRDMVSLDLGGQGFKLSVPEGADVSDVGWEIYPEGFYRLLKATAEKFPAMPILITENGIADSRDAKRAQYLESHLAAMARAMSEGVNVEGYCHWSLMDNFEWSEGFEPRFGLFEVDYSTQTRTPR
ncbi:MAG: family 1 glycosylhydrolase, partial [Deltaproteobacteria bacterium]|nr:family 1 glycosylhydrolase [Deltaproteobacteria bacterium]